MDWWGASSNVRPSCRTRPPYPRAVFFVQLGALPRAWETNHPLEIGPEALLHSLRRWMPTS
jgi:hypothetical protein